VAGDDRPTLPDTLDDRGELPALSHRDRAGGYRQGSLRLAATAIVRQSASLSHRSRLSTFSRSADGDNDMSIRPKTTLGLALISGAVEFANSLTGVPGSCPFYAPCSTATEMPAILPDDDGSKPSGPTGVAGWSPTLTQASTTGPTGVAGWSQTLTQASTTGPTGSQILTQATTLPPGPTGAMG
jgi:hypothetical protein